MTNYAKKWPTMSQIVAFPLRDTAARCPLSNFGVQIKSQHRVLIHLCVDGYCWSGALHALVEVEKIVGKTLINDPAHFFLFFSR
jgi:hypothetical protein